MFIQRLINKIFKNNQRENPSRSPFSKGRSEGKEEKGTGDPSTPSAEQAYLDLIEKRLLKLEGSLDKAISGYRLMLINNNPDILPELITGESIEALDASLLKARELTGKIKEKLETKAAAERIPEGSPIRSPPDTENMSSEEKIKYGLMSKRQ